MLSNHSKKMINVDAVICIFIILALFVPTRGSILFVTRNLAMICAVALGILWCMLRNTFRNARVLRRNRVRLPRFFVAYAAMLILINLIHFNFNTPIGWYLSELLPLLVSLVIVKLVYTERIFNNVLEGIVNIFMVYAMFCIVEAVLHINIFDILTGTRVTYELANEIRFGFARTRGFTDLSLNNGMLLSHVLAIVAYKTFVSRRIKYRVAYLLILIACILTISRTAWVQLIITQFLIFINISAKKKNKIVVVAVALILLVLIATASISLEVLNGIFEMIRQMTLSMFDAISGGQSSNMQSTIGHRFVLWQWVFEDMRNDLLLGKGIGTQVHIITASGYLKESIEVQWLYLLYTTGLVGMINFIVFQVNTLRYTHSRYKQKPGQAKLKDFNYIVFASSVGYFVALFASGAFEDLYFFYWMIALLIAKNRIDQKKRRKAGKISIACNDNMMEGSKE